MVTAVQKRRKVNTDSYAEQTDQTKSSPPEDYQDGRPKPNDEQLSEIS